MLTTMILLCVSATALAVGWAATTVAAASRRLALESEQPIPPRVDVVVPLPRRVEDENALVPAVALPREPAPVRELLVARST